MDFSKSALPPNEQMQRLLGQIPQAPDLAFEVAELRREIAALREELRPVPSLIVTGREALDAFKRLHCEP